MKKFKFLSIILCIGICFLGYTSCSDDDDPVNEGGDTPTQQILAVGFDTERPVKRISYYHPSTPEPAQSLSFTWAGKNITSMSLQGFDAEQKEFITFEKYEYLYQGKEIVCKHYEMNEEGKLEPSKDENCRIQLDHEGYAQSCTNKTYQYSLYGDSKNPKRIDYATNHTYQVERDALHRVTLLIHSSFDEYQPEDLQWLKDNYDYDPQGVSNDSLAFEYDAAGNQLLFTFEYTELPNVNGFHLACMHAYHYPRSMTPICMGPYDLFHVVKTPNLPAHFEHELYKYEVDNEGYVTKVYDLRDRSEDWTQAPYSVFEY